MHWGGADAASNRVADPQSIGESFGVAVDVADGVALGEPFRVADVAVAKHESVGVAVTADRGANQGANAANTKPDTYAGGYKESNRGR